MGALAGPAGPRPGEPRLLRGALRPAGGWRGGGSARSQETGVFRHTGTTGRAGGLSRRNVRYLPVSGICVGDTRCSGRKMGHGGSRAARPPLLRRGGRREPRGQAARRQLGLHRLGIFVQLGRKVGQ